MGVLTRAVRNITRRKVRVMLVIVALSLSMAIMTSIPAGITANQEATERLTENFESVVGNMETQISTSLTLLECSNITSGGFDVFTDSNGMGGGMRPPSFFSANDPSYITAEATTEISQIDGVKDIVPYFEKSEGETESIENERGTFEIFRAYYTIAGVPLNSSFITNYAILPTNILEGRNLQEGDSGVVLLSEGNVEYFDAGVGDTISILGESFEVVGIYESSDNVDQDKLYMEIDEAQKLTDLEDRTTRLDIYAEAESDVDDVATEIATLYPEFQVSTYDERLSQFESMREMYETSLENSEATLSQTQAVAYQEIGIAIVATSLIVLFTMLYTVRERTHEIGVLKAIGFSNGSIMSQLMFEGVIISLIAGVIGVVLGAIGAPFMTSILLPTVNTVSGRGGGGFAMGGATSIAAGPSGFGSLTAVSIDLQLMVLVFGLAVVLGAVGTLYPAWRASRTSPMEALRYE